MARILKAAFDECNRIADEERADRVSWIDQQRSQLGGRRHSRLCRERLDAGLPGAARVGRRFLLAPEVHAEELAKLSRSGPAKVEQPQGHAAELEQRLKLVAS
jgi:hypothetical protein